MECGECTECCELLKIDSRKPLQDDVIEQIEIYSPAGDLCNHCEKNVGCKIHEMRPLICRTFQCAYTQHENAPIELRPDNCGVIFEKLDDELVVGTIRPNRQITSAGIGQIKSFNKQGYSVVLTKYDTNEVKVFENAEKERRDVMVKFAKYRKIADG